jgi:hypothetical protein
MRKKQGTRWPNERAARQREGRRWQAREAARYIREGVEALYRAAAPATDSDETLEAMEDAKRLWLLAGLSMTLEIPVDDDAVARKLEMVAKVLRGQSINPKYDALYREAYDVALRKGNRYDERPIDPDRQKSGYHPLPFPSEVWDALAVVLSNRNSRWYRRDKRAMRRRLAQLGYGFSQKAGTRRKNCHGAKAG